MFYWKLFVDFDAILEKENGPLVFNYGKPKNKSKDSKDKKGSSEVRNARIGQGKYR